jgi:hypothetical protein
MATGAYRSADATAPAHGAVAVTKSDVTVFPCTRSIYVGVTGDVVVTMIDGQTPITFKAVPVGVLPIQVTQVLDATTATDILALY